MPTPAMPQPQAPAQNHRLAATTLHSKGLSHAEIGQKPVIGAHLKYKFETFAKGIFLPPALFANAHLLLNKLRFTAELKNKNIRFGHAVSSYAKLSI